MQPEINSESPAKNAEKKRILFVITQSELGGAQQFLGRLISELDENSFFPSIIVGKDGSHEIKDLVPSSTPYAVARHLKRNPGIMDDLRAVFELRAHIREFRPDILFLNSSKAGFIGSLAAYLFVNPRPVIIYRIGGWTFNDPWPTWKKVLYRWMERLSAWLKDVIIVNSRYDLEQARRFSIKPKKDVMLIHNGIDPYLEFLPREEARIRLWSKIAQAGPFHAQHIIGTIANFYPAKSLSTLLEAMTHVDEQTICIIIGDGPLRMELEALIKSLRLEKKVYLAGKISAAYQYLPAFDVFVLPSVKEGFPWAVLESMAAKVPVVATQVGAVSEVIESGKNGTLIEPRNALEIAGAVQELLSNDRLRQEYEISGHQTVLHRFNLRSMVEAYERLFLSL